MKKKISRWLPLLLVIVFFYGVFRFLQPAFEIYNYHPDNNDTNADSEVSSEYESQTKQEDIIIELEKTKEITDPYDSKNVLMTDGYSMDDINFKFYAENILGEIPFQSTIGIGRYVPHEGYVYMPISFFIQNTSMQNEYTFSIDNVRLTLNGTDYMPIQDENFIKNVIQTTNTALPYNLKIGARMSRSGAWFYELPLSVGDIVTIRVAYQIGEKAYYAEEYFRCEGTSFSDYIIQ